jgi:hypothetical protein
MAWRDEMADVFAPAERMAREIALDLAECRRGLEACRTADISLTRAYAAKLEQMTEEGHGLD